MDENFHLPPFIGITGMCPSVDIPKELIHVCR